MQFGTTVHLNGHQSCVVKALVIPFCVLVSLRPYDITLMKLAHIIAL